MAASVAGAGCDEFNKVTARTLPMGATVTDSVFSPARPERLIVLQVLFGFAVARFDRISLCLPLTLLGLPLIADRAGQSSNRELSSTTQAENASRAVSGKRACL